MNIGKDDNESDDEETTYLSRISGYGKRHLQVTLLFFYCALAFAHKVNMSVGIVAMANNSSNPDYPEYEWDELTRGIILSSLFWGYAVAPIPAGLIAQAFGPKTPMLIAMLVASMLTILTPEFTAFGWKYLCASRIIIGFMHGFGLPCIFALVAKWIHPIERSFLTSVVYAGSNIGTISMLAFSGIIAESQMGWPGIFLISGGLGLVWTIFWFMFGDNTPAECLNISVEEQTFIESMPGTSYQKQPIPWKKIFKSKAFLSLLITQFAGSWGFYLLLTQIPSYINGVMHFNIASNALLSSLPYFLVFILSISMSWISDYLTGRGYLTIGVARKIFNTVGMWIPMILLIALGYTTENAYAAITLLTLAVAFNSGTNVGFFVNHLDLAPNFAGTLMGLTTGISNTMSILAPIFVGSVVTDTSDASLWRIVFFVTAAIFFTGNLVFIIFGSGDIQEWNEVLTRPSSTSLFTTVWADASNVAY